MSEPPPTRMLTIVAKDPGLRLDGPDGPMAFTQVSVQAERLAWGPTGYRVKVVDYNATEQRLYLARQEYEDAEGSLVDPFAPRDGETLSDHAYQARLLADPNFHSQNVYAIAYADARRVRARAWSSRRLEFGRTPAAYRAARVLAGQRLLLGA